MQILTYSRGAADKEGPASSISNGTRTPSLGVSGAAGDEHAGASMMRLPQTHNLSLLPCEWMRRNLWMHTWPEVAGLRPARVDSCRWWLSDIFGKRMVAVRHVWKKDGGCQRCLERGWWLSEVFGRRMVAVSDVWKKDV